MISIRNFLGHASWHIWHLVVLVEASVDPTEVAWNSLALAVSEETKSTGHVAVDSVVQLPSLKEGSLDCLDLVRKLPLSASSGENLMRVSYSLYMSKASCKVAWPDTKL